MRALPRTLLDFGWMSVMLAMGCESRGDLRGRTLVDSGLPDHADPYLLPDATGADVPGPARGEAGDVPFATVSADVTPKYDTGVIDLAAEDAPLPLAVDASPVDTSIATEANEAAWDSAALDAAPVPCRSTADCPARHFCFIVAPVADCLQGPLGACVIYNSGKCTFIPGCGCFLQYPNDPCALIPGTWCDTIPPLYGSGISDPNVPVCAACLPKQDAGLDGAR
jgi:hypothetical protein